MLIAESALGGPTADDPQLLLDARGAGEWIVSAQAGGPALHVYRLGEADWLVSVVGRGSEGRGRSLAHALGALAASVAALDWWSAVPALIDEGERERGRPPLN